MTFDASDNEVAGLTWDKIKQRLAAGAAAILPIGAGAKQHGLHMPMATDQLFAAYFARALAERIDALTWPTLTYGAYPAFAAYAGSVSLSTATFQAVVTEIADALIGFGATRVLILDTGLSTIAPVGAAISATREPSRVRHLKVFAGPRFEATVHALKQQPYGSHADEMETSLMLAIAPELVDMTRARPTPFSPNGPSPGALSPDDPASPNYAPSGSFGDPTLASANKGARLRAAILDDLLEAAT
ncbi:MAG: creatininase family protein [Methyloceanibacter sp.]